MRARPRATRKTVLGQRLEDAFSVMFSLPHKFEAQRLETSGDHVFSGYNSEELKKAVAVSEEKIKQRSRRRGQFSSSRFPCQKVPKPWQG